MPSSKRTLVEINHIDSPIKLEVSGTKRLSFTVTYGREVTPNLNRDAAAIELGQCIMHALACTGKLDIEE